MIEISSSGKSVVHSLNTIRWVDILILQKSTCGLYKIPRTVDLTKRATRVVIFLEEEAEVV